MRIVSTVPSQTELLYDLGLRDEVVGITKFCVHPDEWFSKKIRIGGTKNLNIKKIIELQPDLIIANKEENVKEQIEELQKHFKVYVSDIKNLSDALKMIQDVGELVNRNKESEKVIKEIKNHFNNLNPDSYRDRTSNLKQQSVIYLIWKNPYMTVGNDTFIHDMITLCGFKNIFGELKRYPEITSEQIASSKPDLIFLSSEPYQFKEKHIEELKNISPASRIILVNGEYFSWYGSRLLKAADYFSKLIDEVMFISK
jgi:ABC-type Fe3+-hydroxamate transport system substrate-binding protein